MTADRSRRERNTWIAFAASVAALAVALALAIVAVRSMADSRAGRDIGVDVVEPVRTFPWTSTALIGVVDDGGTLRASAAVVIEPDSHGGAIVSVSPSADARAGSATVLRPFGAVFAVDGPESWRLAMEQFTGLSFDVVEVVDHDRLDQLLSPLGDLPTTFPHPFADAATGDDYARGETVLTSQQAFEVLTAVPLEGPAWQLDLARDAVWAAIADRVGAGIGSLDDGVRFDASSRPADLDQVFDALFDAQVAFRSPSSVPLPTSRVQAELPIEYVEVLGPDWDEAVVVVRKSEAALMFASLAPARIGAPLAGPTVRLVSGFTTDDTSTIGLTRSDLLIRAINTLLFAQANVVSVVDAPNGAFPDVTRVLVADQAEVEGVWATYRDVFGEMQVVVADAPLRGVDMEIVLGRDFLPTVAVLGQDEADMTGSDS